MVELIRPELPLSAGLCVFTGELLALGTLPYLESGVLGFLVGFLISGAAMVSNDYYDLAVDLINHPDRPLPSGRVSRTDIIALTIILAVAGLLAASLLGVMPLVMAAAILLLGVTYNWKLKEKGLMGNLMVSTSVGATFVFGGVSVGDLNSVVLIFASMAFTFDLAEEIAADAMDAEGDKERSVRSLAITFGREQAIRISAVLFMIFILLTVTPYLTGWLGLEYLIVIAVTDVILAYLIIDLVRRSLKGQGRSTLRRMYLVASVMVLAFVIARLITG